jgi:hypothetical protein
LSTGPGGGLATGASNNHYRSNRPPWPQFRQALEERGLHHMVQMMERAGVR